VDGRNPDMGARVEEDRTKDNKDRIKVEATRANKVEKVKQAKLRDVTLNWKAKMLIWTLPVKKMKNQEVKNQEKKGNPEDQEIAPCYKAS
jgi:hypothetical protein